MDICEDYLSKILIKDPTNSLTAYGGIRLFILIKSTIFFIHLFLKY